MAELIQKQDTLNEGRVKINAAITDAEQAKVTAGDADSKATQALAKSESTQTQLDTIVINGDSSVEAAQARVDEKGVGHTTLKDRIDDGFTQVTSQLNDNIEEVNKVKNLVLNYTKYGDLWLPPDYADFIISQLPFKLFRDFKGQIKHDFNFDSEVDKNTKIYLRKHDSSNSNDGLSSSTPVTTILTAVNIAINLSEDVTFVFMDKFGEYSISEWAELNTLESNYNVTSYNKNGTILGSGIRSGFNWVRDQGLFKTSRTAVGDVYNYNVRNVYGQPKAFKKVNSISECQSSYMSYYTDGTSVWINYSINAGVNRDIGLNLKVSLEFTLNVNDKRVVIDKIGFLGGGKETGSIQALKINGNDNSEVYINKLIFKDASLNGLADVGVGKLYVFDSVAIDNGVDGFNYHGSESNFIFEYNCYGAYNGTPAQGSANATTAHDGMTILRVGSIGEKCYGPVLADVGGCVSINIDCRMYDSLLSSGKTKAAFYFSDSGGISPGKSWLINCEGGGDDTFSLYAPNENNNPVNIINFKGLNIEEGTNVNVIT